jgi:hypothetical protein
MALARKHLAVLAACLPLWLPAAAAAQDAGSAPDQNPFLPPPTAAEIQAQQDAHVRDIVRQMMPEIDTRIVAQMERERGEIDKSVDQKIADKLKEQPVGAPAAPGAPGAAAAASPGPALPEGAKFVACVNGKALYSGENGVSWFAPKAASASNDPCPGN